MHDGGCGGALIGGVAGQQVIERAAECVDVDAFVEFLAGDLLGCGVVQRGYEHSRFREVVGLSNALAVPKSVRSTRSGSPGARRMFAGFTSRCRIPARCA